MMSLSKIPLAATVLFAVALFVCSATRLSASCSLNSSGNAIAQDNSQSDSAASAAGTWQVSWTGRGGIQMQGSMQIEQDGSSLSGTFQAPRGSTELSGNLQGNHVSIQVKAGRRPFTFSGTLDGDKMSGTTSQGSSWSATRQ